MPKHPAHRQIYFTCLRCCWPTQLDAVRLQTLVPHSLQNFVPGVSSAWQFAHFCFSWLEPHSLQNLAPAWSLAPHFTQGTPDAPTSTFAPHSLQNFDEEEVAAPHFGHLIVAVLPVLAPDACGFIALDMAPAIALPTAKPAPSPAPKPAPPDGFCAASRIASAAWNWAYRPTSPITPIEVRLSMAASTSGGSEIFSMTNLVSSRPNALKSWSSLPRRIPPSSSYCDARSSAAIFDSATASLKPLTSVRRSCPSISSV